LHAVVWFAFFFSSRRRHTRSKRDWSSDVCSSDLGAGSGRHRCRKPCGQPCRAAPCERGTAAGRGPRCGSVSVRHHHREYPPYSDIPAPGRAEFQCGTGRSAAAEKAVDGGRPEKLPRSKTIRKTTCHKAGGFVLLS